MSSTRFETALIAVIVLNALAIGLGTYPLAAWAQDALDVADRVFLAFFILELLLKLLAVRGNPRRFFSDSWTVFDFLVVAASLTPGISDNSTALRLVRLARVSRLIRLMPDVRVLGDGMRKAAGPALSLLSLTGLLVYVYAVLGWVLFHDKTPDTMPQYFDNIGESMLTLFELLTLEGWNTTMHDLRSVSSASVPYVLSFLLIGTYIVINMVIGVVITSLDDAYKDRDRAALIEIMEAEGHSMETMALALRNLAERLDLMATRQSVSRTASVEVSADSIRLAITEESTEATEVISQLDA